MVDQNDRRKNLLFVTKKGERYIADFMAIELKLNEELEEGLSEDDLLTFYKIVNHFKLKAQQLV